LLKTASKIIYFDQYFEVALLLKSKF